MPVPSSSEGQFIGRYRIIRKLALGGMGEVFLARHDGPANFSKLLVVKRILAHLASSPKFVELFLNEARLAAQLLHPNVVQIFELGEADGSYFIAMEYIPGMSLRAIAQALAKRKETLDPSIAARLAAQALHGLHYAHELKDERGERLNIVHRDVSPDNILVGQGGAVKVLDFGIAKAMLGGQEQTATLRGKYNYMSPEQMSGERLDARADLYAMGVLLYELVTGQLPFPAAVMPLTPQEAYSRTLIAPSLLVPSIPADLDPIVLRAIGPAPQRYRTAEEMAQELLGYAGRHSDSLSPARMDAFLRELLGPDALDVGRPRQKTEDLDEGRGATEPSHQSSEVVPLVSSDDVHSGGDDTQAHVVPSTTPSGDDEVPTRATQALSDDATHTRAQGLPRLPLTLGALVGLTLITLVWWRSGRGHENERPADQATAQRQAPGVVVTGSPGPAALETGATARRQAPASLAQEAAAPELREERAPARRLPSPAPGPTRAASRATESRRQREAGVARRQADAGEGRVLIRVYPWAEVSVQGKTYGTTPMPAIQLPAGPQTLTLKNAELGVVRQIKVQVVADEETNLSVNLLKP